MELYFKILLFAYFLIIYFDKNKIIKKKLETINNNESSSKLNIRNGENITFGIIAYQCKYCGLFSIFNKNLKCILSTIQKGIIPIIDLTKKSNVFNHFNKISLKVNPWEIYFNQPFGYMLNDIKNKSYNIININCHNFYDPDYEKIYDNSIYQNYWRSIAEKYAPIKQDIIIESEKVKLKLFRHSKNILGILMRGTDFISAKPKYHHIPPSCKIVFDDIKKLNDKNKYDYYFITTEDNNLRNNFINKFKEKLKYFTDEKEIKYNYKKKKLLANNRNIKGNFIFMKNYLINILILSGCLDILSAKTNGAIGAFIFSKGFRYSKVYDLGFYK